MTLVGEAHHSEIARYRMAGHHLPVDDDAGTVGGHIAIDEMGYVGQVVDVDQGATVAIKILIPFCLAASMASMVERGIRWY